MKNLTSRYVTPLIVFTVLVLLGSGSPVAAQTCIQDLSDFGLQCTAKDVKVTNIETASGEELACPVGEEIEVDLVATLLAGAQERYDIGIFVSENEFANAQEGMCGVYTLEPTTTDPALAGPMGPFLELETYPDMCGDIGAEQTVMYHFTATVSCVDLDDDGLVDIETCLSWENNKKNDDGCEAPDPNDLENFQALPGTPSKCRCETANVGNLVVAPKLSVKKEIEGSPASVPDNFTVVADGPDETDPDPDTSTLDVPSDGTPVAVPDTTIGTWTLTEDVPMGWEFKSVSCTDGTTGAAGSVSVDLDYGDEVVCTFTNRQLPGNIIIEKQADFDPTKSFNFTGPADSSFSLQDGEDTGMQYEGLAAATYQFFELVPDDWSLTSIVCTDGSSTSEVTDTDGNPGISIDLMPAETVRCVFTNEPNDGTIKIVKHTGIETTQDFVFSGVPTPDGTVTINGTDASGMNMTAEIPASPGSYTIGENVTPGWSLTGIECTPSTLNEEKDLANRQTTFTLPPGVDAVCTFTNEEDKKGTFKVVKKIVGYDPGTDAGVLFDFDVPWSDDPIQLGHNSMASMELDPGMVTAAEDVVNMPEGFTFVGVRCVSDADPENPEVATSSDDAEVTVELMAEETITCTWTNKRVPGTGSITVTKQAEDDCHAMFDFDVSWLESDSPFDLWLIDADCPPNEHPADMLIHESGELEAPMTYTIEETFVQDGWFLADIQCTVTGDGGSTWTPDVTNHTVSIDLEPGDNVHCVFYNEPEVPGTGKLTLRKATWPKDCHAMFDFDVSWLDNTPYDLWLMEWTCYGNEAPMFELPAGIEHTVIETFIQEGWALDDIICTSDMPPPQVDIDVASRTLKVTLRPDENVVCTFKNKEVTDGTGTIIVKKDALKNYDDTLMWDFELSGGDLPAPVQTWLGDEESTTWPGLTPGNYWLKELWGPSGWHVQEIVCKDETGQWVAHTYNGHMVDIDLQPGQTITCTFVNAKDSHMYFSKQATPDTQVPFRFVWGKVVYTDSGWSYQSYSSFDMRDGEIKHPTQSMPSGKYWLFEYASSGWQVDKVVCGGQVMPVYSATARDSYGNLHPGKLIKFDHTAGESITCTFYNEPCE